MTYQAQLYDVVTPASVGGDVDWYRRKARESGGPVLELGAGTGRITLAMARDGIEVHALDASPEMLGALSAKLQAEREDVRARVRVLPGNFRHFALPERFPLVIAPFRAFLHNVTEEDQLTCLANVRDHLRPGGTFAFNLFHPSVDYMTWSAGPLTGVWRWGGSWDHAGGVVVRSEANRYDGLRRVVQSLHRYEEYDADGTLVRTSLHRLELALLYPADIRRLLAATGFRSVTISGGFDGRELSSDKDEIVVEAIL
jgi:SAM-dependent methyltransferase